MFWDSAYFRQKGQDRHAEWLERDRQQYAARKRARAEEENESSEGKVTIVKPPYTCVDPKKGIFGGLMPREKSAIEKCLESESGRRGGNSSLDRDSSSARRKHVTFDEGELEVEGHRLVLTPAFQTNTGFDPPYLRIRDMLNRALKHNDAAAGRAVAAIMGKPVQQAELAAMAKAMEKKLLEKVGIIIIGHIAALWRALKANPQPLIDLACCKDYRPNGRMSELIDQMVGSMLIPCSENYLEREDKQQSLRLF